MKAPTKQEIETAIRVIEYLRDSLGDADAAKIEGMPDGKHWDKYVDAIARRCEERNARLDDLIEDIRILLQS